jgi:hypothetical protein
MIRRKETYAIAAILLIFIWPLNVINCKELPSISNRDIIYKLATIGESQATTCLRNELVPVPKIFNDNSNWNYTTFNAVVKLLNQSISPNSTYGINGCCSPGMWCDKTGCFTQSYGSFANFGFLNGNSEAMPVYSCYLPFEPSTITVNTAYYEYSGKLLVQSFNLDAVEESISASVGGESCNNLQFCNSNQCRSCLTTSCPQDSECVLDSGSPNCYMYCAGPGDESCPCGSYCDTVTLYNGQSKKLDVLSLCTYSSFSLIFGSTCPGNQNLDAVKCQAPRAAQKSLSKQRSILSIASDKAVASITPIVQSTNLCYADSHCFDGNICTIDSCKSGYCSYISVDGCDSTIQAVRERVAPYTYSSYSQSSMYLKHLQFERQVSSNGNMIQVDSTSPFHLQTVALPFNFDFFGVKTNSLTVNYDGSVSLPPIVACDATQSISNVRLSYLIFTFHRPYH